MSNKKERSFGGFGWGGAAPEVGEEEEQVNKARQLNRVAEEQVKFRAETKRLTKMEKRAEELKGRFQLGRKKEKASEGKNTGVKGDNTSGEGKTTSDTVENANVEGKKFIEGKSLNGVKYSNDEAEKRAKNDGEKKCSPMEMLEQTMRARAIKALERGKRKYEGEKGEDSIGNKKSCEKETNNISEGEVLIQSSKGELDIVTEVVARGSERDYVGEGNAEKVSEGCLEKTSEGYLEKTSDGCEGKTSKGDIEKTTEEVVHMAIEGGLENTIENSTEKLSEVNEGDAEELSEVNEGDEEKLTEVNEGNAEKADEGNSENAFKSKEEKSSELLKTVAAEAHGAFSRHWSTVSDGGPERGQAEKRRLEQGEREGPHLAWRRLYDRPLPQEVLDLCLGEECRICGIKISSTSNGSQHYSGSRHAKSVNRKLEELLPVSGQRPKRMRDSDQIHPTLSPMVLETARNAADLKPVEYEPPGLSEEEQGRRLRHRISKGQNHYYNKDARGLDIRGLHSNY